MDGRATLSESEQARWTRIGMLAGLAMVLGYLETFVPIPLPGVKLGLANIAILLALADRDSTGALFVAVIKILAAGLLFGNPMSMAYAFAGTALSLAVMIPLSRLRTMNTVVLSIAGALAHEIGQLIVAMALLGTTAVWYSLPIMLVAGVITGALCGILAQRSLAFSENGTEKNAVEDKKRFNEDAEAASESSLHGTAANTLGSGSGSTDERGSSSLDAPQNAASIFPTRSKPRITMNPKVLIVCFIVFSIVALHAQNPILLGVLIAIALVSCYAGNVKMRAIGAAVRPCVAIIIITFIAQMLNYQEGTVLCALGPLTVTAEAIEQTGIMAARLLAITGASIAIMHLLGLENMTASISWFLKPLARIGVRTEPFVYAFNVALASVPTLLSLIQNTHWNWNDWRTALSHTIPAFIARSCQL